MKYALKLLVFLIGVGFIFLVTSCQRNFNYESFNDLEHQGIKKFNRDLKACLDYGQSHSKRNEGSQGAGERLLLNRNLILICMEKKQWIIKIP